MAKTYDECCVEVGLNRRISPPELVSQWFGYSGGAAIPCTSMNAAMQYSLYECLVTPESEKRHDEYFETRRVQEAIATEKFLKYLRMDYIGMSDELYDACYEEAYRAGGESGYDDVARCLCNIVVFINKIKNIR
jgi:hypothetical protein